MIMADVSRQPRQLKAYWLGTGLTRWARSAHPYTALVRALRSEGVPGRMVHGLAANIYTAHFGHHPGRKSGKKSSASKLAGFLRKRK